MKCFKKYTRGFTWCGTFSEYCQQKSRTPALAQDAEEADRFLSGSGGANWNPSEILSGDRVRCTISRTLAGPSRADIVAASGGKTPEEMGLRLQDLKDHEGNVYKGIMIPSPSRPFVEFTFSHDVYIHYKSFDVPSSSQAHERQPDHSHEFIRQKLLERPDVSPVVQKMKTCPWTWDDIVRGGKDTTPPAGHANVAARLARHSEGKSDDGCSVSGSGSARGANPAVAPGLDGSSLGPSLNRLAAWDSVSVCDGRSVAGSAR